MSSSWKAETQAIHSGELHPRVEGAITMPIFQSSTFVLGDAQDYRDIRYIRLNTTPNHRALAQKMAALEGTEEALVTSSGMAAITGALLSQLRAGDHVIAQNHIYGGTYKVFQGLVQRYGISVSFVSLDDPDSWEDACQANTRAFYVESITNPWLEVGDLKGVVDFAQQRGLVSMIDNTFLSPAMFQPAAMGFDLVLHSASKYLNGHSDLVAGVIAGSTQHLNAVSDLMNLLGPCLDPHACFLLQRGLKSLPMRMRVQCAQAQELAQMLDQHPEVDRVFYPGLPDSPYYQRAREWFGAFGAVVSLLPKGGVTRAQQIIQRLQLMDEAPSLGGLESLVCRPATTMYAGMPADELNKLGIDPALIRIAVGAEHIDDLKADLNQALQRT